MKQNFTARSCLLLMPFIAFFGIPVLTSYLCGEFTDLDNLILEQSTAPKSILFGPALTNRTSYYKLESTLQRDPVVLALGSSRVMQFRSRFFTPDSNFYNAGGAISNIYDLSHFISQLPSINRLKIIILGLDQWYFNQNWKMNQEAKSPYESIERSPLHIVQSNWKTIWKAFLYDKAVLKYLTATNSDTKPLGLFAIIHQQGFRTDGSYQYAKNHAMAHANFEETLRRIEHGTKQFKYGDQIAFDRIEVLRLALNKLAKKGVYVVGFFPPFPKRVYETLIQSNNHKYIRNLQSHIAPIFASAGFNFFDFSDMSWVGSSDKEALDGHHGSEKTYLRILSHISRKNAVVGRYMAVTQPDKLLAKPKSQTTIF